MVARGGEPDTRGVHIDQRTSGQCEGTHLSTWLLCHISVPKPAEPSSSRRSERSPSSWLLLDATHERRQGDERKPVLQPRRRCDGDEVRPTVEQDQQAEPARPQMIKEDSASTVRGESGSDEGPKNASAEPGGSGLPQRTGLRSVSLKMNTPVSTSEIGSATSISVSRRRATLPQDKARAVPLDVPEPHYCKPVVNNRDQAAQTETRRLAGP